MIRSFLLAKNAQKVPSVKTQTKASASLRLVNGYIVVDINSV